MYKQNKVTLSDQLSKTQLGLTKKHIDNDNSLHIAWMAGDRRAIRTNAYYTINNKRENWIISLCT